MKRVFAFLSAAGAAGAAYAGGLSDSIVESPVTTPEVAQTAGSTPSWVIPVVILGLLAVAASSGSGSSYDY